MKTEPALAGWRVRLKAWLRSSFALVATISGLARVWQMLVGRRSVRILAYHGVETPPSSPFAVSVERFEEQIAYLTRHFDVIDLATLRRWQEGDYESDRRKVVLTFDDGFRNNLDHAAPILRKFDAPATFFVIGSKLDGGDGRFMTRSQASALLRTELFQIGSHSLSHVSMARISDAERSSELGGSKSVLEKSLDREVSFFCYPYGTFNDFDARSAAALKAHGYALACTSINGVNFRGTDPMRLRRTKVEWSDDLTTFRRLLNGALDGWIAVDFFLRFLQRPRAVRFDGGRGRVSSAG